MTLPDVNEYAVLMSHGRAFYTGGFNSVDSLCSLLNKGVSIEGAWGRNGRWSLAYLNTQHVVAITDLRGN